MDDWLKSNSDISGVYLYFAYWWSCIGEGLLSRLCYQWGVRLRLVFLDWSYSHAASPSIMQAGQLSFLIPNMATRGLSDKNLVMEDLQIIALIPIFFFKCFIFYLFKVFWMTKNYIFFILFY